MAEICVKQFKSTNHSPGLMDYKVNIVLQQIVMACHVMSKAYQVYEGNNKGNVVLQQVVMACHVMNKAYQVKGTR